MLRKPATKIGGPFETAKRNLLKDVKGFEKHGVSDVSLVSKAIQAIQINTVKEYNRT